MKAFLFTLLIGALFLGIVVGFIAVFVLLMPWSGWALVALFAVGFVYLAGSAIIYETGFRL